MDSCSRSTSQESGASCCDLDIEEAEDLEENCDGNKPSEDFNDEDEHGDQDIHDMTSLEELEPLALSESRENSPKIRQLLLERARSQDNTLMIQIAVDQDKIQTHFHGEAELQLVRALTATSLLHREHCSYAVVQSVLKYWQNRIQTMPVEDVLLHPAGSRINVSATDLVDAGDFIATLSRWQIRVFAIGYKNCKLDRHPADARPLWHHQEGCHRAVRLPNIRATGSFFRINGLICFQNEDLAMAHFQSEEIELFELAYNNEFPARVVEAYLNAFEQSDVGLGELKLRFPVSRLPEQLPHCGLQCNLLHQSDQRFELLLRTVSAPPRHVLVVGRPEEGDPSRCLLTYELTSRSDLQSILPNRPDYRLLHPRFKAYRKHIVSTMPPIALTVAREETPEVNRILMKEAKKRHIVAAVELTVTQNNIQMCFPAANSDGFNDFVSTSLLLHRTHPDCTCRTEVEEFWGRHLQKISTSTALLHLAGTKISAFMTGVSDAGFLLDELLPLEIGMDGLTLQDCRPLAILQTLHRIRSFNYVTIMNWSSQGEKSRKIEQLIIDQFQRGKILLIDVHSASEFPERIVEANLQCFQENKNGRSCLQVIVPAKLLPQQMPLHGLLYHRLRGSWPNLDSCMLSLLRAESSTQCHRHIFFYARPTRSRPDYFILKYFGDTEVDRHLRVVGLPPNLEPVDYSDEQVREIVSADNWPRYA